MKISDEHITQALAEMPEIDLPYNFHEEVMAKIRSQAASPAKKRPPVRILGALAAAALVLFAVATLDFATDYADADADWAAPFAMAEAQEATDEAPIAAGGEPPAARFNVPMVEIAPLPAIANVDEYDLGTDAFILELFVLPEHLMRIYERLAADDLTDEEILAIWHDAADIRIIPME